ncbi:threonine/serine exporter family protein [Paenibacillus hodogayensis]|uniref:Threonine/serine exporter family protein n=1 Tax=Paenibacillus hodogayensis TaxID=279208 RepID=A0ABV5W707_9BACL
MDCESVEAKQAIDICLLAGKMILQSGGETVRVEDTMMRLTSALGYPNAHSFVTPTVILFSIDGHEPNTRIFRISERSTDLRKLAEVNDISRKIVEGGVRPEEAYERLKRLDEEKRSYPLALQAAGAALVSGCFLIMFRGGWPDFIPAVLAGAAGYVAFVWIHRFVAVKFFAEFLAAFVLGAISRLFVYYGLGHDLDKIIIGSVMPLVPGVLITNAVRDLMAGHLLSGTSKGAEAFLTAFAIGAGIALVLSI